MMQEGTSAEDAWSHSYELSEQVHSELVRETPRIAV
jgi:hypothetical protein